MADPKRASQCKIAAFYAAHKPEVFEEVFGRLSTALPEDAHGACAACAKEGRAADAACTPVLRLRCGHGMGRACLDKMRLARHAMCPACAHCFFFDTSWRESRRSSAP